MDEPRKDTVAREATGAGARICPQCGAAFICGLAAAEASGTTGEMHCWCFDLPAVMPLRTDTACLCPACLLNAIRQKQEINQ